MCNTIPAEDAEFGSVIISHPFFLSIKIQKVLDLSV